MDNVNSTRSHSAFKSQIFEILVGSSAESFYAHADVLAKSEVLRKTVQGPWRENTEAKLYWREWEASAVEGFLEWLYTGDYKCPYPVEAREEESSSQILREENEDAGDYSPAPNDDRMAEPEPAEPAVDWPADPPSEIPEELNPSPPEPKFSLPKYTYKVIKSTKTPIPPLTRLQELEWDGCRALNKLSQAEEFDKWTGHQLWRPDELDYKDIFMTHAKLYVMACFYRLDELKNMAWQRLRSVLVSIGKPNPRTPVINNLVTLLHYVYQETGDSDTSEEEPLRMLITSFAALNFTNFKGSEVNELMMSGQQADREFVVDLMDKVAQQMSYLESKESANALQKSKEPEAEGIELGKADDFWGGSMSRKKKASRRSVY
ncbi:MAG: hypothetical protein Q9225_007506 [Loekoesia sp. 1 TL-2023]